MKCPLLYFTARARTHTIFCIEQQYLVCYYWGREAKCETTGLEEIRWYISYIEQYVNSLLLIYVNIKWWCVDWKKHSHEELSPKQNVTIEQCHKMCHLIPNLDSFLQMSAIFDKQMLVNDLQMFVERFLDSVACTCYKYHALKIPWYIWGPICMKLNRWGG